MVQQTGITKRFHRYTLRTCPRIHVFLLRHNRNVFIRVSMQTCTRARPCPLHNAKSHIIDMKIPERIYSVIYRQRVEMYDIIIIIIIRE